MTKQELEVAVAELEEVLVCLESRLSKTKKIKTGRKEEVQACLEEFGHISVVDIASKIGVSSRNVSSQLSYLRKAGVCIATDSKGRKFIED